MHAQGSPSPGSPHGCLPDIFLRAEHAIPAQYFRTWRSPRRTHVRTRISRSLGGAMPTVARRALAPRPTWARVRTRRVETNTPQFTRRDGRARAVRRGPLRAGGHAVEAPDRRSTHDTLPSSKPYSMSTALSPRRPPTTALRSRPTPRTSSPSRSAHRHAGASHSQMHNPHETHTKCAP